MIGPQDFFWFFFGVVSVTSLKHETDMSPGDETRQLFCWEYEPGEVGSYFALFAGMPGECCHRRSLCRTGACHAWRVSWVHLMPFVWLLKFGQTFMVWVKKQQNNLPCSAEDTLMLGTYQVTTEVIHSYNLLALAFMCVHKQFPSVRLVFWCVF